MEAKETYYDILGIDTDVTEDDIRKAYRKQALLWHPDKNSQRREEAEARFKLIAEAYEVLSDAEKRRIYDIYGEEGLKNGGPSHDSRQDFAFQFHDPLELFNTLFGGRDPFSSMFADPFFDTGFGRQPFGFPSFGPRPFGAGPGSRSLFDNHPFFPNNIGSSSSSFSFSSNSSSGGGQGGYVRKSTTTQLVNGVRKTVTKTEDAQGNVTIITETPDGRQVYQQQAHQQQALPRSSSDRFNIPIQDGGHQQYQQYQQPPYQQQQQQQYHQQPYQQQQQQQYHQQPYQQQQYHQQPYQQQQQQYQQQQYQQQQYQDPQGESHPSGSHRKLHWPFKKK